MHKITVLIFFIILSFFLSISSLFLYDWGLLPFNVKFKEFSTDLKYLTIKFISNPSEFITKNLSNKFSSIRDLGKDNYKVVYGHQHHIKLENIPANAILKSSNNIGMKAPGYFGRANNTFYIVSGDGFISNFNSITKEFIGITSNLDSVLKSQNYSSILPDKTDLSSRFGIRGVFFDTKDDILYVSYPKLIKKPKCYAMAIASAKVSKNSTLPLNFQDFFISNSCNSNFNPHETGGKIFADDNVIFFTIGASEVDNIDLLSSFDNDLGSIVSINKLSKEYYVFAKGLRNPQGLSIVDKKVFITSQGPMGGDIFSKVKSGDNFGWPVYSYGFDYNYKDLYKKPFDDEKIAEPTFYFTPSLATSPLIFYTGNEFPRFKNKFILGTLKDKSLLIIDYKFSTNRVASIERFDIDSRIRDVSYDSKGIIYIITDGGELLKLSRNVTDMKYKNE